MGIKNKGIACMLVVSFLAAPLSTGTVKAPKAEAQSGEERVNDIVWKYGLGDSIGFNEGTFTSINKNTTDLNCWREGSVTANGEIGFIESCDPKEDVFIFNNTKIVTDNGEIYETPDISGILDQQRKGAISRDDFPWIKEVDRYAQDKYGAGWGMEWTRSYQPAAQYRIINNDYTDANLSRYNRYTNYETGEVGVQWKDDAGNEWNRRSFASRSDNVIVTYIEAPDGQELNVTLTMDHLVEMCARNTVYNRPDSDYVVTEDSNGYAFGMVAKYPILKRKGSKQPEEALFARGGYGTATRIITDGNIEYAADKRTINVSSKFNGGTINDCNDPKFTVTGTNSVMLVTKVDRIDTGCDNVNDVKEKLYDVLLGDIDGVIGKYGVKCSEAGYKSLLEPHAAIHGGMFNNVRIDLCSTEEEKADRELTNSQLRDIQEANSDVINKAYLERIYNNGRFGLICASGYGTTKLGAIWTGEWEPMWSGDYTLDANTNLQVSGMNTGNMQGAGDGYINFIVRMVDDWIDDAAHVYGMTDAIKAPPRVDGTGQAGSYHFSDGYPHIYVNGITDWLIIPIYEYWQCYGNQQVPLCEDIIRDIEKDREVLDLSDADIARIEQTGCMDLVEDILYPMLMKTMNFWLQYVDDRYYTDGEGVEHADDGTTINDAIAAGDTKCKYIYTPGYSPENSPTGYGDNSREALTYNTTMDIAASRSTLAMARSIIDIINPSDKQKVLSEWADFESKIPDYMYAETGELKEWATNMLVEKHSHRHISHAYVAWPSYDTQSSEELRQGVLKAVQARSDAYNGSEATESHGAMHKALVQARLKNSKGFCDMLKYLMSNGYQYTSMMSSHNRGHDSLSYCTDSAFGIMGAVNESLLYSNTGVIEILPALMEKTDKGSIHGLRARCNTQCDVDWDIDGSKANVSMTSDENDNVVKVRCGLAWDTARVNGVRQNVKTDDDGMPYVEVTLNKGVAVNVEFSLTDSDSRLTISADTDISKAVKAGTVVNLKSVVTFERKEIKNADWTVVNAAGDVPVAGLEVTDGKLSLTDALKGMTLKIYASADGIKSNELLVHVASGGTETFGVCAVRADDDGKVAITNDGTGKNLMLVWTAYDASGKLMDCVEKDVTLQANEFSQVIITPKWQNGTTASLYVWDKSTMEPYADALAVK